MLYLTNLLFQLLAQLVLPRENSLLVLLYNAKESFALRAKRILYRPIERPPEPLAHHLSVVCVTSSHRCLALDLSWPHDTHRCAFAVRLIIRRL